MKRIEELEKHNEHLKARFHGCVSKVIELEKENESLSKFANHLKDCNIMSLWLSNDDDFKCTCGYSELNGESE